MSVGVRVSASASARASARARVNKLKEAIYMQPERLTKRNVGGPITANF